MALTISLTPQPDQAGVLVQVTADDGEVLAGLTRTDPNGTASVRLLADQDLSTGVLTVTDYEAALTGALSYTVTASTGETATALTTLDGLVARPYITVPVMPAYSVPLTLVLAYADDSASQTSVHRVVGRDDPVLTIGVLQLPTGVLELFALTYADAVAIRAAYRRGVVVMLRQPDHPGQDMYHVAERVRIEADPTPTVPRRWRVIVDFVATSRPLGPLQGTLGWSFDDVTAAYPDFNAVRDSFESFAALAAGPVGP